MLKRRSKDEALEPVQVTLEAFENGTPMQSYLFHEEKGLMGAIKTWKKRWFKLSCDMAAADAGKLLVFHDQKEKKLMATYDLSMCTSESISVVNETSFHFRVHVPGHKTEKSGGKLDNDTTVVEVMASDAQSMDTWTKALRVAIVRLSAKDQANAEKEKIAEEAPLGASKGSPGQPPVEVKASPSALAAGSVPAYKESEEKEQEGALSQTSGTSNGKPLAAGTDAKGTEELDSRAVAPEPLATETVPFGPPKELPPTLAGAAGTRPGRRPPPPRPPVNMAAATATAEVPPVTAAPGIMSDDETSESSSTSDDEPETTIDALQERQGSPTPVHAGQEAVSTSPPLSEKGEAADSVATTLISEDTPATMAAGRRPPPPRPPSMAAVVNETQPQSPANGTAGSTDSDQASRIPVTDNEKLA